MIIQIRGTSGSGKSTVMRRVVEPFITVEEVHKLGRRKPLYYRLQGGIFVLGHYESPCGGCDTIGSAKAVYDLIQEILPLKPKIVLCEGLLLSEDVKWTRQLHDPRIFFLATPIDQCVEWIKKRREEVGNYKPLNESNTRNRVAVIERAYNKLRQQGIYCRRCTVESASTLILDLIRSVIHV